VNLAQAPAAVFSLCYLVLQGRAARRRSTVSLRALPRRDGEASMGDVEGQWQ